MACGKLPNSTVRVRLDSSFTATWCGTRRGRGTAGLGHVTVLRTTVLIDAPTATVGAALRHTLTAEEGLLALGVRGNVTTNAGTLLVPGDELAFGPAVF